VGRDFPEEFIFGTATAAHQIEGGNVNSDWWAFELDPSSPCVEPSGDACDSYHRYEEDIAIVADLGLAAYRFSVEWARVEPEPEMFSSAQFDRYRRVVDACRDRGLLPIVTLQHFTLPRWLADRGGFAAAGFVEAFIAYAEQVGTRLGDGISRVCTFNEPSLPPVLGYEFGVFPPGRSGDTAAVSRALDQIEAAHRGAAEVIRRVAGVPVGLTVALFDVQPVGGISAEEARSRSPLSAHDRWLLEIARDDDFVGVQAYTRLRVGPDGPIAPEEGVETTAMGYEFWPWALEAAIRYAWEVTGGTPILVTENGIATADDDRRIAYVAEALRGVAACLDDGIDVEGYLYWSLLDNFEWTFGYAPTFGLVAVDRESFVRTVKPSGAWYGEIAAERRVP
jgi:beta-glucosidase